MSSSPASSVPWRSLVGLALSSPTIILLFVQGRTHFLATWQVNVLLLDGLALLGTIFSIIAAVLGYLALDGDPRLLASCTFLAGSSCVVVYLMYWLSAIHPIYTPPDQAGMLLHSFVLSALPVT
ncbi:MAG TPA: hypothetical protein VKB76_17270 [Ktedonobacterales bacterium]|nr:hypothetical protein [Ktedonobacterales bacterium]